MAMARPWPGHGLAMVWPWPSHGSAMSRPWPGHGSAMAWPQIGRSCVGRDHGQSAMGRPWLGYGQAIALLGHDLEMPWPWLGCGSAILSSSFITVCPRHNHDSAHGGHGSTMLCMAMASPVGRGHSQVPAAPQSLIGSFGSILMDFWPRDRSQRRRNGRAIHLGGFLRPGNQSGPISGHFGDFGPDRLSET